MYWYYGHMAHIPEINVMLCLSDMMFVLRDISGYFDHRRCSISHL